VPARAAQHRSVVLVFGENLNDARSIARLVEALCPKLRGRVQARPKPISLQRSASLQRVRAWTSEIAAIVAANQAPVLCVLVHRDTDGPDALGQLEAETNRELARTGLSNAHAVAPVEEIEAWWLMFPAATEQVRSSWRGKLRPNPGEVDSISDPKRELIERTGRNNAKHRYGEADSPDVADRVAAHISGGGRPAGSSQSFERFRQTVQQCCPA
jgi:hypothetical protein